MLRCTVPPLVAWLLLPAAALAGDGTAAPMDAATLSNRIDVLLAVRQTRAGVQLAPRADDAEFFRRLCLDVIGRIPSVAELMDFLDDNRPDKRARWIDELLDGTDYAELCARNFAVAWRILLLSRTGGTTGLFAPKLETWLVQHFKDNTPYDRLVHALLTSPDATAYYRAHENKPENIAGSTARLFLGVKLECAQCHDDRTGAPWKRTQFWEYAAFFSDLPPLRTITVPASTGREGAKGLPRIQIPDTQTWVECRFLDGSRPSGQPDVLPRTLLADWMTRASNPWFARAAVNRLWHACLGTGLIDPVDGLGSPDALASHPELLDELTRQFLAHRFDQKYLLRAILGSQAYQRTSRLTHESQREPRHFARAVVRGLRGDQVYHSFLTATGYRPAEPAVAVESAPLGGVSSAAGKFLSKFGDVHEQPTAAQTAIQQALFLMNDKLINEATSLPGSQVLSAVVNAGPGRSTAQRIEDLTMAVLSRPPRPEESQRLVRYVENGEPTRDRTAALRDVFWMLLNSTEFALNH